MRSNVRSKMAFQEKQPLFNDWGFLKGKYLALFTVIYNGMALALVIGFWGHQYFISIVFCTLGFLALLMLLALRLSDSFRALVVKPDSNDRDFLSSLTFPIILWATLPTVMLFLPIF